MALMEDSYRSPSDARCVVLKQLERLGEQIEIAVNGLSESDAVETPIEGLPHIRQILMHLVAQNVCVAKRLSGEPFEYSSVPEDAESLSAALAFWRSTRSEALDAQVLRGDRDVVSTPFGTRTVIEILTLGFAEHDAYHLGQLCYLRRAIEPDWDPYSIYSSENSSLER